MNKQEITQFLAPSRIAVMATINRDGTPQLTPNWYHTGSRGSGPLLAFNVNAFGEETPTRGPEPLLPV